jgi:AraC-like DNA-binding protein
MLLDFSTDGVTSGETFDVWADTMHTLCGMRVTPSSTTSGPFRGRISGSSNGPLLSLSIDADGYDVQRSSREIAARPWNSYWIYREAGSGTRLGLAGREIRTAHGDLIVGDADVPLESWASSPCAHQASLVPKALLDPHLPRGGGPLLAWLSGREGVAALAATYFEALTRELGHIAEQSIEPVLDTLCRLIGIASGAPDGDHTDAVQAGRLAQATRYIDRHLADPDLSPALVAAALGVSPRALHLAFEPSGVSFARHVLRRRLEECRAALLRHPMRPVTDIAFAWGFGSLSGFYRAFQASFGMSPGDLRATAADDRRA